MLVFLVRHGVAVGRGSPGYADDSARPLTEQGISRMRRQARGVARLGGRVDVILTSPFVRCAQTAEILKKALPETPPIVESPALRPTARLASALNLIAEREEEAMAIVGHEPMMSELASLILVGDKRLAIDFKKGGVCCIRFDGEVKPGAGTLVSLLPPRALRGKA